MSTVKIKLLKRIHADFVPGTADAGVHDAKMNPHGALSVQMQDGRWLGVMPNEFQFVDEIPPQWLELVDKYPHIKPTT